MEIFDRGGIVLTRCHANEASKCLLLHLRSFQFLAMHHGIPRARLFKYEAEVPLHVAYGHTNKGMETEPYNFSLF